MSNFDNKHSIRQTSESEPKVEITFEVRLNGRCVLVTKEQLFELARKNEVLPDDVITVAGTKIFADSVEGIIFGSRSKSSNTIPRTDPETKKSIWFYYDETGMRVGPITGGRLKGLAKIGKITQETLVESEKGKSAFARDVKGLKFPLHSTVPPIANDVVYKVASDRTPAPIQPSGSKPKKSTWFYYNENGEKIGPVTNREMKNLANLGTITPETIVENKEGDSALAKHLTNLPFPSSATAVATVLEQYPTESVDNGENCVSDPFNFASEPTFVLPAPPIHKESFLSELGKTLEGPFGGHHAWLRDNFETHKKMIISGIIAVFCLLGCFWALASSWDRSPAGVVYITGTVTLDGQPIQDVSITLCPLDDGGTSASGRTDKRGRFIVRTTVAGARVKGAMEGEYDVIFEKSEMVDGGMFDEGVRSTPPNITYFIPQKYTASETSGIESIRIGPGGKRHFLFELTSEATLIPVEQKFGNQISEEQNRTFSTNTAVQTEHEELSSVQSDYQDIFVAARYGTVQDVAVFVRINGAIVNSRDRLGNTPLHEAAQMNRDVEILRYLLAQEGINVNARNSNGRTPLDVASTESKRAFLRSVGARNGQPPQRNPSSR